VATAVVFSVFVVTVTQGPVLGILMGLALAVAILARLPLKPLLRRLVPLNILMLLLFLTLPVEFPGREAFRIGSVVYTTEGLWRTTVIAAKANAIVLLLTALLATIELNRLGHALEQLGVPDKLVQLLHFTVRYLDLLHHEYHRLTTAMKVRGFQPRANLATCRALGYLAGMLLVRSHDRSERVMHAMRCRGFNGRFHSLELLRFEKGDGVFSLAALLIFVATLWLEVGLI
jgi:cobalt/nickel transport system permease protein